MSPSAAAGSDIVADLRRWLAAPVQEPVPELGFVPAPNMPHHRDALQNFDELRSYLDVLSHLDSRQACLEVGLYRGATHFAWRRLFGLVISIERDYWACCKAAVEFHHPASLFVFGESASAVTLAHCVRLLDGRPLDHLFIDGSHDYSSVLTDFLAYAPLVRSSGIIGFHDVCLQEAEISRLLTELEQGRVPGWPPIKANVIGNSSGIGYFPVP